MGSRMYSVLEMGAVAKESDKTVPLKFVRGADNAVELTISGRFRTVHILEDDALALVKFLTSTGGSDED